MPILLLSLFILMPLVEIAVFIEVGGWIGLWPTLGLCILTALLGSWQLRSQGMATLERARTQIDQGQMPAKELFNGACLLIAGALLLVPGFVTDAMGALLFIPAVREALRRGIGRRMKASGETRVFVDGKEVHRSGPRDGVIDGEFEEVPDEPPRRLRP
ncbi:MAG: FxsA family protein [Pseudomonadota bacterium]